MKRDQQHQQPAPDHDEELIVCRHLWEHRDGAHDYVLMKNTDVPSALFCWNCGRRLVCGIVPRREDMVCIPWLTVPRDMVLGADRTEELKSEVLRVFSRVFLRTDSGEKEDA